MEQRLRKGAFQRLACQVACAVALVMSAACATDTVDKRQQAYLDSIVKTALQQGPIHTWVDEQRFSIAHALLTRGVRLDEANQYLSEVEFASLSRGLIYDNDVQVTDLIRTYLEFRDGKNMSDAAKAHLKQLLAGWEPPNRDRNRDADSEYEWPHEYTENHTFNIVVAAYLIDDALGRPRALHRDLVERFLADRIKWGWSEFNSPRYGMVTTKALVLLADFAPDKSVSEAARMQLDLMAINFSTYCIGYWRGMPSARGGSQVGNNARDAFLPLARLWFGDPSPNAQYAGGGFIAHFLTSPYRPPQVAIELQKDQVKRGRYVATQVATSGPAKLRVPIVMWVTPYATMASAQGGGSYYDGAFASISFASAPANVISAYYGKGRNILQHRNVMATFGTVAWHGKLNKQADGKVTIGGDGKAFVGQVDLGDSCHLLIVSDDTEYADAAAFRAAVDALGAAFDKGVVSWKTPDGKSVKMANKFENGKWHFVSASVDDTPVRIDRNLLYDSPYMRSVRGSKVVEVLNGGKKWVYDFRDNANPEVTASGDKELTPLPTDIAAGPLGMELACVPPGEFVMGSAPWEGRSNELPLRWVHVDGFYMSTTEVTVAQYNEYLKANERAPRLPDWYAKEWGKTDQYAITWVTWHDAKAFCDWLSQTTGDTYRLPTEAEWEKAAKGFTHRVYPWGNTYDGTQSGSRNETYLPVKSKPMDVSPFGIYDMSGNVWEWCADWYDRRAYASSGTHNPTGPQKGKTRVLRSCGWNYDPDTFRASYRSCFDPAEKSVHIGFRVVRELKQEP